MVRYVVIALLLVPLVFSGCQQKAVTDPRTAAPTDMANDANARHLKNIFVNPAARPTFQDLRVGLAPASPEDALLVRDPSAWRAQDRKTRYDGVLLAGPLDEFQPLLQHLVESPDFHLVRVDNWGLLFNRTRPVPYSPPPVASITASVASVRADILSQTAVYLDAAGLSDPASDYIEAALAADPDEPLVQTRAGSLDLSHKRYQRSLGHADAALKQNPKLPPALEIKARALLAMGATDAAWQVAEQLLANSPEDDMAVLYFHARLANAASAYSREQTSLEKLIALAEKHGLPTTDYRVYLGQCYARQGLARPALIQLEAAAQDPNLSPSQRSDVETSLQTLRERTGNLAP